MTPQSARGLRIPLSGNQCGVCRSKLPECTPVYILLKVDDIDRWIPIANPAPISKLRFFSAVEPDLFRRAIQLHQEPALLLSNTPGFLSLAQQMLGDAVTEPATGLGNQIYLVGFKANFFVKFSIGGILRGLPLVHPALRELPGITCLNPFRPKHITCAIGDYNTNIGPIAFCIYQSCFNQNTLKACSWLPLVILLFRQRSLRHPVYRPARRYRPAGYEKTNRRYMAPR